MLKVLNIRNFNNYYQYKDYILTTIIFFTVGDFEIMVIIQSRQRAISKYKIRGLVVFIQNEFWSKSNEITVS